MSATDEDFRWMARALQLARRGLYSAHPNPRVGCVIVAAGKLGVPELAERSFVVSSFGKTYHATGWKVGYCIAPAPLTAEFRKVHQFVQFAVATPMQAAFADFMQEHPEHHERLPAYYQHKRDHFCGLLANTRFRFTPSSGTYFQLVDYSAVSDLPDVDFARQLTTECGVAAIPISVSCAEPPAGRHDRFCFAKHESTLDAAGERLMRI